MPKTTRVVVLRYSLSTSDDDKRGLNEAVCLMLTGAPHCCRVVSGQLVPICDPATDRRIGDAQHRARMSHEVRLLVDVDEDGNHTNLRVEAP